MPDIPGGKRIYRRLTQMKNKIVVVGGGAAGLMAGGTAAQLGAQVLILEKNPRVGRKIAITGKGRCNLTNACDVQTFIQHVPVNGRFLYSALNYFTPDDAVSFFEKLGLQTKTERGNRVFPKSDKALDVVDTLRAFVLHAGGEIHRDTVTELVIRNGGVTAVRSEKQIYPCDAAIVCCGGRSYPLTGSTGDGYLLAGQAGHTVTPLKPSLVPMESKDACCKEMQGLALKNISLELLDKNSGKILYRDFGELLFTHFGLSGPVILSASSHVREVENLQLLAIIDLKPALSFEQLDQRIQRDFQENINRDISNSLSKLLPKKMIPVILKRWGIARDKKCRSVTREERRRLAELLKKFTVSVCGFRPIEEAIVTSGGVKTSEINPKTMESKLVSGLYFAGEVIDVDAYTGGFNLQIAWSTGKLSGESAAHGKEV